VRRIAFIVCVASFLVSTAYAQAQETASVSLHNRPVATRSQADCTGFIADPPISNDLSVLGGADDDFHSVARQFVQGESIFFKQGKANNVAVGSQFSVVRPANQLFLTMHYSGERWEIRKLGKPYEDVGLVEVTHVNPEGVVAKVAFSCGPIMTGDVLMAFQPRPVPEYIVSGPLDHFAPLDQGRQHGRITASHNNLGFFGRETVVYINLGERDGAKAGQRFRIYKNLPPHPTGFMSSARTPAETIGELVVMSVQAKSSSAMVISSYREIAAGDFVEAE